MESHTDRKKYLRGNTSQDFRSLKDFGSLSSAVFIWDPNYPKVSSS